jgi:hypothetical protein
MIIRSKQFEILKTHDNAGFVAEMADHLRWFAPKICEVVGKPGVHRIAESGILRARDYGLTNRGPIRFFLELISSLGVGFDTDPQLPWIAETLNDASIQTDMLRADCLYKRMVAYLDHVSGPNNQYTIEAIDKTLNFNPLDLLQEKWSQKAIMNEMAHMHPQKYDFIGEDVAAEIASNAAAQAEDYGLPTHQGAAMVLAGLQFALGHRICEDPFYPWIAATLNNPRAVDGEHKLNRLKSKLRTYGKAALTYLTQPEK